MSNITNQQVATGNILQLMIGGKVVGLAQTADGRRGFGTEAVHGLGNFAPVEHVQLKYDGTLAIERFYIRNADLRSLGLAALSPNDVLSMGIITALVIDTNSNKVLRQDIGVTISDHSETFRANAIAGENATFKYLDCQPLLADPAGGVSA